jgi:putative sigma-54 modulation protein
MHVTYTGRNGELTPDQQNKLDARFAKLAKLVERKDGDKGAHVAFSTERHITSAEITVNFYDHGLIGIGSGPDSFTALSAALDKIEKQALKVREKFRDTKRGVKDKSVDGVGGPAAAEAEAIESLALDNAEAGVKVFPINHHERRKPMTLEEAMIQIDGHDYYVYRDADKDCVSVLIRRRDGNFDLVEG